MRDLIWKIRYALVLWHGGVDWKTSWYSAGESFSASADQCPVEMAQEELDAGLHDQS